MLTKAARSSNNEIKTKKIRKQKQEEKRCWYFKQLTKEIAHEMT